VVQARPRAVPATSLPIALAKDGDRPLFVQIREQVTDMIVRGELRSGIRLPPVRSLARQLKLNQMTVAKAYKELAAGGFVEGRRGGGTFVRSRNHAHGFRAQSGDGTAAAQDNRPLLSQRLFELARAPGVIAFTGNYPQLDDACLEEFRACLTTVANGDLAPLFRYDPPMGRPELRLRVAEFLREQRLAVSADDVVVTAGGQQGIDLVVRCLVPHGAAVVIERPAYYGAINALRGVGAHILEVPLEADGMNIAMLEAHLKRHRPRLIYTNPTFQNPTGVTTSDEKRRAILKLARHYGVAILEDDHCPELRFAGKPAPTIRSLAEPDEPMFYVRGFGKALLPGCRIGFVLAPASSRQALLAQRAATDLHGEAVMQEAMALYLARGRYREFIAAMRKTYAERQRALCDSLRQGMPDMTLVTVPDGGLSLWLTLPDGADVSELYFRAVRRGVAFVSGEVFYASRSDLRTLRISFGLNRPDELREGVERLCSVVRDLVKQRSQSPLIVI
jgi:2-aminoadipate transaminase